jgi:hypothetical protein
LFGKGKTAGAQLYGRVQGQKRLGKISGKSWWFAENHQGNSGRRFFADAWESRQIVD